MSSNTFLLFALLASMVLCSHAEIYKWTDENGKVHYSDNAPENQATETINVDEINTFESVTLSEAPGWKGFFKDDSKPARKTVVMYSTARCGYCKQAKAYFEKNRIPFMERRIDEDREAYDEFQELGGRGVPVILIGTRRMNGFSAEQFAMVYAQETAK